MGIEDGGGPRHEIRGAGRVQGDPIPSKGGDFVSDYFYFILLSS